MQSARFTTYWPQRCKYAWMNDTHVFPFDTIFLLDFLLFYTFSGRPSYFVFDAVLLLNV